MPTAVGVELLGKLRLSMIATGLEDLNQAKAEYHITDRPALSPHLFPTRDALDGSTLSAAMTILIAPQTKVALA